MIIIKTPAEFSEIIANKGIVYFFAQWCGPCKTFGPRLEEVSKDFPNIEFAKVDVENDELADVVAEYGIRAMPTIIAFESGGEITREIGVIENIEEWVEETFE